MPQNLKFLAGEHIERAAKRLISAAASAEDGRAAASFNGVDLIADRNSTIERIIEHYTGESERKAKEYRESPEGLKAAKEADERRLRCQEVFDSSMQALKTLNFNDERAVLDWLCNIQNAADHVGITGSRASILEAFASKNLIPNMNCGDAFNGKDRHNFFRYLVGQALDGFAQFGAPHPILHTFVAEWKQKFLN
jgi:hypothetical protein